MCKGTKKEYILYSIFRPVKQQLYLSFAQTGILVFNSVQSPLLSTTAESQNLKSTAHLFLSWCLSLRKVYSAKDNVNSSPFYFTSLMCIDITSENYIFILYKLLFNLLSEVEIQVCTIKDVKNSVLARPVSQ